MNSMLERLVRNGRIFVAVILTGALVSVGLQGMAYGGAFVFREPPYNFLSDPNQGCVEGFQVKHCARAVYSTSAARVFNKDNAIQYSGVPAKVWFNVNPPNWQPFMNINQYRNLYFYSLMDGQFEIKDDPIVPGATAGEMKYGGWTVLQRPADGIWVKDYYFYAYQTNVGVHNIDNTNVYFIKGYNAGKYSMGSLFEAFASGSFELGAEGIVDAWNTSKGYGFLSWMLAIEWCDSGVCNP